MPMSTCVQAYFTYSLVRHLDSFHNFVLVTSAAINTDIQTSLLHVLILWVYSQKHYP